MAYVEVHQNDGILLMKENPLVNTVIQVEIPEEFQRLLAKQGGQAEVSRLAFEGLVVDAVRRGLITRGFGGELLGLSFSRREEFFAGHGVSYDLSPEEIAREQEDLDRMFRDS